MSMQYCYYCLEDINNCMESKCKRWDEGPQVFGQMRVEFIRGFRAALKKFNLPESEEIET